MPRSSAALHVIQFVEGARRAPHLLHRPLERIAGADHTVQAALLHVGVKIRKCHRVLLSDLLSKFQNFRCDSVLLHPVPEHFNAFNMHNIKSVLVENFGYLPAKIEWVFRKSNRSDESSDSVPESIVACLGPNIYEADPFLFGLLLFSILDTHGVLCSWRLAGIGRGNEAHLF